MEIFLFALVVFILNSFDAVYFIGLSRVSVGACVNTHTLLWIRVCTFMCMSVWLDSVCCTVRCGEMWRWEMILWVRALFISHWFFEARGNNIRCVLRVYLLAEQLCWWFCTFRAYTPSDCIRVKLSSFNTRYSRTCIQVKHANGNVTIAVNSKTRNRIHIYIYPL